MHDAACDATVYSRCDTTIGIFIVTFVSESIHKIQVRLLRFLETRNPSRLRLLGFVLLQLQPMGAPQSGSPNGGSKMWRLKWAARRAALRCLCGPGGAAFEGSSRIWTGLVGLVSQGVGGPTVCSCFEPLLCAPSSRCGRGALSSCGWRPHQRRWEIHGRVVVCGHMRADRAMPLKVGRRVAPVRRRRLFDLGVRPCVTATTASMAGQAAWIIDHCGQPPGRVCVSFGLHGGGREDARLWQVGVR
jgi:hypothetical protein